MIYVYISVGSNSNILYFSCSVLFYCSLKITYKLTIAARWNLAHNVRCMVVVYNKPISLPSHSQLVSRNTICAIIIPLCCRRGAVTVGEEQSTSEGEEIPVIPYADTL